MAERLRAAVVGAAGIGKFHAQWYALEGCEVVGTVGTTAASVEAAAAAVLKVCPSVGPGTTDFDELLRERRPHVVSICTPPDRHLEPAEKALAAGAAVLCEKPLVWHESAQAGRALAEARQIAVAADRAAAVFAMNTQYVTALGALRELYRECIGPLGRIESVFFEMESRGNRRGPSEYEANWMELAPHALSVILALFPDAQLETDAIVTRLDRDHANAEFRCHTTDGQVAVTIITACCHAAPPVRRIGINGFVIDVLAVTIDGRPRTILRHGQREMVIDDLMQQNIRAFIRAARREAPPLASAWDGVRNLELQLAVLDRFRR